MPPDLSRRRARVVLVLGILAFAAVPVILALALGFAPKGSGGGLIRRNYPARVLPPVVKAADARLSAAEPVIGIFVAGKARAYRADALSEPTNHVVSDRVGDRGVVVTYCDVTGCARAFSGNGPNLLDIRTGGYDDGLVLFAAGRRYRQDTQAPAEPGVKVPFPYLQIEVFRTTWGEWLEAHPDTDVVTELAPAEPGG